MHRSVLLNNCYSTTTLEFSKKKVASDEYNIEVIFENEVRMNLT